MSIFLKGSSSSESATSDLKVENENVRKENNAVTPSSKRRVNSLPSELNRNVQTRNDGPGIGSNTNHSNSGFSFIKGGGSSGSRGHVTRKETLEKVPSAEEGSTLDSGPRSGGIRRDGSFSISSPAYHTPKSSTSSFRLISETEMMMLNTTHLSSADIRESNSIYTSNSLSELVPPISSRLPVAEPVLEEAPKGKVVTHNSVRNSSIGTGSQHSVGKDVVARGGIPATVGTNVSRAQPLSYGKKKLMAKRVGYRRVSEDMTMPPPSVVLTSPLQSSESLSEIDSERHKMLPSPSLPQTAAEPARGDSVVSLGSVHSIPHSPHDPLALPTSEFEPTDSPPQAAIASDRSGVLTKKEEEEERKRAVVHQHKLMEQEDLPIANNEKVEENGQLGRSTALCRSVVRDWSQQVSAVCRELDTCSTNILDWKECQLKAIKSESVAVDELASTEAEQAELAETEDFEAADSMSNVVEDKKVALAVARNITRSLKVEREALIEQLWHCRTKVLTALKQGKEPVEDAIVRESKEFAKIDAEKRAELGVLDQIMKDNESRLIMEQSNIERDMALLQDERQQLESVIHGQTVGEETRCMELVAEREKLEDELNSLLQSVAAKREQLKGVEEELLGVDVAVERVRNKFNRQLQRLADREHLLCVSTKECDSEMVALRAEMEENQTAAQKGRDAQRSVTDDIEFASTELKASANILETLSSHWETLGCGGSSSNEGPAVEVSLSGEVCDGMKIKEDHAALLLALRNAESALHMTETAALRNEAARRESEIEVASILAQLPELEASKRASIASRGYKEAASLSRQIKTMECRKIKALECIDEASRVDYTSELKSHQLEVEAAAKVLERVEREGNRLRLERLMRATECLQMAMNSICSTYGESLLVSSAMVLLNSELNASKSEVTELVEKYNFKRVEDLHRSAACEVAEVGDDNDDQNRTLKCEDVEAARHAAAVRQSKISQQEEIQRLEDDLEHLQQSLARAVLDEDFDRAIELDEQIQTLSKTISELSTNPNPDDGEEQTREENQAAAQIEESEISEAQEPKDATVALNNPELGVECSTVVECDAVTLQSDAKTNNSTTLNQTAPCSCTVPGPEEHKSEEANTSHEMPEDSGVEDDDDAVSSDDIVQLQHRQPEEVCDDPLMVQTTSECCEEEEAAPQENPMSPHYLPVVGNDDSPISCSSSSLLS